MKVQVLLSSFNGHKYLDEQLGSIFSQKNIDVEVIVRDDGSTDDTISILERWSKNHALRWYKGENIGASRSFFNLLQHSGNADFYAFADEDDVWLPDKLYTAAVAISECRDNSLPVLYFCDNNLVNQEQHFIGRSIGHSLNITKGNGLLESFAAGCTMVFNQSLRDLVCSHIPSEKIYHDRWTFLSALFLGKVIYDEVPHMNYRQHGNNLVGTKTEIEKGESIQRVLKRGDFSVSKTANLFLEYYSKELSPEDRWLIENCANYENSLKCRFILAFSRKYKLAYGSWKRRLYWKARILLKKI